MHRLDIPIHSSTIEAHYILRNKIREGTWLWGNWWTLRYFRNSWEYKMARRIIIGTAVVVTFAGAAILVACDFDDARAAAVIGSIPRTLSTAGTDPYPPFPLCPTPILPFPPFSLPRLEVRRDYICPVFPFPS